MSRLDELPPDQRAALSVLLRQRKSYADVAAMLGIGEQAVHDRAHAALAVLAPQLARELAPERRSEIGDYLLGQQAGVAERLRTRTYLGSSEPARAWAQALTAELAPLAEAPLPDIPQAAAEAVAGAPAAPAASGPPPRRAPDAAAGGAGSAPAPLPPATPRSLPSSRVGGAVLLAVLVAVVVVAIVLLTGGSSGHPKTSTSSSSASAGSTGTGTGPTIGARLPLRPPSGASRPLGLVQILSEGSKRAFYLVAEGLAPSKGFFYALWLYNAPSSSAPLGKAPPVGASHRLEGGGALPANAGSFHTILLTRETSTRASHPGQVVLSGPFKLTG
jgi:hypothetical protein